MHHLSKPMRRKIRDIAALAWERELSKALGELEADFTEWREGELDAFELTERIHDFHQGPSRALYKRYSSLSEADHAVASALVYGVLTEEDVPADVAEALAGTIEFHRNLARRA